MRPTILATCVFAAACGGQALDSPTSPSSAASSPAQTPAQSGTELPFSGSFTIATTGVLNCPPTCPPTTVRINGIEEGSATYLGRFTAVSVDVVDLAAATSTGTFDFTAANGDQLFTTTIGHDDEFQPPNNLAAVIVATIMGGTGRFEEATGTLTIRFAGILDFASGTSSGSGSLEGHISLNR